MCVCVCAFKEHEQKYFIWMDTTAPSARMDTSLQVLGQRGIWTIQGIAIVDNSLKQLENILELLEEQNTLEDILVWIITTKNSMCVSLYLSLPGSLSPFHPLLWAF